MEARGSSSLIALIQAQWSRQCVTRGRRRLMRYRAVAAIMGSLDCVVGLPMQIPAQLLET